MQTLHPYFLHAGAQQSVSLTHMSQLLCELHEKIVGLVFTSCVGHLLGRKKYECNTSSAKIHCKAHVHVTICFLNYNQILLWQVCVNNLRSHILLKALSTTLVQHSHDGCQSMDHFSSNTILYWSSIISIKLLSIRQHRFLIWAANYHTHTLFIKQQNDFPQMKWQFISAKICIWHEVTMI